MRPYAIIGEKVIVLSDTHNTMICVISVKIKDGQRLPSSSSSFFFFSFFILLSFFLFLSFLLVMSCRASLQREIKSVLH